MGFQRLLIRAAVLLSLAGCASVTWDEIDMMPPPDVYGDGMLDPLPEQDPMQLVPYQGLLYATDRSPAEADDQETYYVNERGHVLRLGVAKISLHEGEIEWEEARKISLLKNRSTKYPLRVTSVEEYGILEDTIPRFVNLDDYDEDVHYGDRVFAEAVNAQLARSRHKDVYIYVHGYKVVFENPLLVATELWHFLGYDGVMIGYAWPSTPSKWAYIRDTDTATGFARNFRKFLEYLAENTAAEEIHVVAYSNGTRLAARALEQLALINDGRTREEIHARLRLGNVILLGSDLDRQVFGAYLADGVLDVPRRLSIYASDKDKPLGLSRWLTHRDRLGQAIDDNSLTPGVRRVLADNLRYLNMIDVSDAEGAATGNGHGYFRASPWVSSDILMMLMYELTPEQRGLVLKTNMPVYEFPPDYLTRLWATVAEINPEFRRAYLARQAQRAAAESQ
jgi:esterase/lipase superfamily enzyme